MAGIHDRMPVILEPDAVGVWLDTASDDRDEVEWLVHSGVEGTLVHHPVSTRVGNVGTTIPS